MAVHPTTQTGMTLEQFLAWPRIDEKPYLEYIDGQVEEKVSPQLRHNLFTARLVDALNRFAEPGRLGFAFPEQRCNFAGRSIVPDIVFLLDGHIICDENGDLIDELPIPPDIHVEIRSPDQSTVKTVAKLEHSMRQGCQLGWYFDPYRRTIDVYRPGRPPERLAADGFLDGSPVLPGFRLPVADIFGWIQYRKPVDPNPPLPEG